MVRVLSCLLLLVLFSGCASDEHPPATLLPHSADSRELRLTAEHEAILLTADVPTTIGLGESVVCHFALHNKRSEKVYYGHQGNENDFFLRLRDENGDAVPYTDFGHFELGSGPRESTHRFINYLLPGKSLARNCDLRRYFAINKVGTYYLSVLRTIEGTDSIRAADADLDLAIRCIEFHVR